MNMKKLLFYIAIYFRNLYVKFNLCGPIEGEFGGVSEKKSGKLSIIEYNEEDKKFVVLTTMF